jgi:tetratricopeptide (TPR) repeat protein
MVTPAPLLLLAFALHAQDADFFTLGKDHAKFARELYRAGYVDLAESFCTKVENSPAAEPAEVASVRSVHLDLKIEQASVLKDNKAKLAELSTLLKAKEEFIDAYPDSPEAKDAEHTLPDVYAKLGEAYADVVGDLKDEPGEAKRLRTEGSDIFRRGEQALTDSITGLEAALEDSTLAQPQMDALDLELMAAKYNLARTYYFHAALLGKDDPFGKTFYERATDAFAEFGLEYSDSLLYFQGQVLQGQAFAAMGQPDDALDAFDYCIALKDTFAPDEPMPAPTIQVIAWGVQEKMKLLTELKRYDEAIAAADDFLATVKDAPKYYQDLIVLHERMQAEIASGDSAASLKTAQLLVDRDKTSQQYYGNQGREILGSLASSGGGGGIDRKNLLKIAQSQAAKGDYDQGLALGHQVVAAARGSDKPDNDITEAYVLIGSCDWRLKRLEEASLAYDAGYEANPKAEKAGDALYSASLVYDQLYKQTRRPFFEQRADERLQRLAREYPKHPKAASQSLSQAKKLESNDKFVEAAEAYLRVPVDSLAYPDAQLGAATNLYSEAVRLSKEKSPEVKAAATKAEQQLRKAQSVLEAASEKTLDLNEKARMAGSAVETVRQIGNLYMLDGVGRHDEVLALTKEIETKYADDEEMVGEARSLRVRALTALGKVKEAEDFLEGLLAADPDSRSTAVAAGVLARTLDHQAEELFAKEKQSKEGDELWRQAFRYYVLSVKPKLSDERATDELEQVGTRLYYMGEHFNEVPEGVPSFVGLKSGKKPVAPEYWEEAVSLFESAAGKGSYKAKLSLARTLGYLGRFGEAKDIYSELIESESLIDPGTNEINKSALSGRPELLFAYLELGVAQFEAGKEERDEAMISDSAAIFARIVKALPKQASETWWRARYYQLASWNEVGRYKECLAAINDLERNSDGFDEAKWNLGLAARFKDLKKEVERKL